MTAAAHEMGEALLFPPSTSRFSAPSSISTTSQTRSCTITAAPSRDRVVHRDLSQLSGSAVRPPPSFSGHRRLRRRGPRSLAARERRLHRRDLFDLPHLHRRYGADLPEGSRPNLLQYTVPELPFQFEGEGPSRRGTPASFGALGEAEAAPEEQPHGATCSRTISSAQHFSIWFINARSVNGIERRGIILHYLDQYSPDLFGIVETWLDEHSCKHLTFPNYTLVHRRDRPGGAPGRANHGGVILFRRTLHAPMVTFLEESVTAELLWARVETNLGPFLLGLWYRPPNSGDGHVDALVAEYERLNHDYIGAFLFGDLNVHQRRWLRYSSSNTTLGDRIQTFAAKHGLKQLVKNPTHADGNLLDLVLSSLPFSAVCSTTPHIADHNGVLSLIDVPVITETTVQREVWDFKKGDWAALQSRLERKDWSFLGELSVDEAASRFVAALLRHCRQCIPTRIFTEKRKSHPWMTQRCANALAERAKFENTDAYADACRRCGDVFRE